ncbi:hypothetical protein BV898_19797 [Hypsibius exemplaris]|uniref:Uncharacterized protein n=1 Tax=Hypsibius exemplaris TaxID=2072580 RepID=A0A9X6NM82_HYPEX|nr:hypothetical protein BV898_19797 [Hypsibius exemplaris]
MMKILSRCTLTERLTNATAPPFITLTTTRTPAKKRTMVFPLTGAGHARSYTTACPSRKPNHASLPVQFASPSDAQPRTHYWPEAGNLISKVRRSCKPHVEENGSATRSSQSGSSPHLYCVATQAQRNTARLRKPFPARRRRPSETLGRTSKTPSRYLVPTRHTPNCRVFRRDRRGAANCPIPASAPSGRVTCASRRPNEQESPTASAEKKGPSLQT